MSQPKILIADDSVTIQKVFELAFESEGVRLLSALTIKEAYAIALSERPSMAIIDVNMPDGAGVDLCKTLKRDAGFGDVPIYLLTSVLDDFDEESARDALADGTFEKPFRSEDIVAKIKEVIYSSANTPYEDESSTELEDELNAELEASLGGEDDFDDVDVSLDTLLDSIEPDVIDGSPTPDNPSPATSFAADEPNDASMPPSETLMLDLTPQAVVAGDAKEAEDDMEIEVISGDEAGDQDESANEEPRFGETQVLYDDGDDFENVNEIPDIKVEEEFDSENKDELERGEIDHDLILNEIAHAAAEIVSPEEVTEAMERAVAEVIHEMVTPAGLQNAIQESVAAQVRAMKPELLEIFRDIASEVTLSVAEKMVKRTIEQIKDGA